MLLLRTYAMKYDAIVLGGGIGKRADLGFNKVLYKMKNGKTVLNNACDIFLNDNDCNKVIVVCNFDIDFNSDKLIVTHGGSERYKSVLNGLKFVDSDYVLIHDGARPFLDVEDLENLKENVEKFGSAILAKKAIDTIKYVSDGFIDKTIDREYIYYAVTPQGFKSDLVKKCYSSVDLVGITDDASVLEKCGYRVKVVECKHDNPKLTLRDDFKNI